MFAFKKSNISKIVYLFSRQIIQSWSNCTLQWNVVIERTREREREREKWKKKKKKEENDMESIGSRERKISLSVWSQRILLLLL